MTHKSVSQAEREAEAARARLENSLDALRGSLSPGSLFDETLTYARNSGGAEFARNLGRQARDNPLPIALIGAGIAWLMLARGNGAEHDRHAESRFRAASDRFGDSAAEATDSMTGTASDLASQAGDAIGAARDRAAATLDSMSESASQATQRLRRGMHDASDRAAVVGRKVKDGVTTILEEQPLVLGALGLAIGAAMGAAFPSTRFEDDIAGAQSDALKAAASDTRDRAANVAARAFESAYREGERAAQEEGLMPSASETGTSAEKRANS
jgi:hypothetical protein